MQTQDLVTILTIASITISVISFVTACIKRSWSAVLWIFWGFIIIAIPKIPLYLTSEYLIYAFSVVLLIITIFSILAMRSATYYPYTNIFLVILVAYLILTLAATVLSLVLFSQNCNATGPLFHVSR